MVEGGSGIGYDGMVWWGTGCGVCGYLKFENNLTIRYRFDDQTTFPIASLIKILSIQLRFSCDDVR